MRPGMPNSDWSFESRLRGAARPDGHTALELGNPVIPRAKVRGARRTVQFSLEFCVASLELFVLDLSLRFLVWCYERNFSPHFREILTRTHEMLHIWTTLG